jgi:ApaG protein
MTRSHSDSIDVSVVTEYLSDQSNPAAGRYAFAYHVTLTNRGTSPAKLLSRHWIITDGGGHVEEVRGDGVVGEQPTIGPGEQYRYTSGAVLETPVGSMRGSYQMRTPDGRQFDALIPVFTLAMPSSLN